MCRLLKLKKPILPEGEYKFYLTKKGKDEYEKTLLLSHKKYLENIKLEKYPFSKLKNVIYEDEYQIVDKMG